MKTLDEVIDAIERCSIPHYFDCKGCAYEDADAEVECRSDDRDADVLYYLRELAHYLAELDNPDGDHQQLKKARNLLWKFYQNDPLSWDELKTMEGKPVWVEVDTPSTKYQRWVLVCEYTDTNKITIIANHLLTQIMPEDYGNTWQAYRKERE